MRLLMIMMVFCSLSIPSAAGEQESRACTYAHLAFFSTSGVSTPQEITSYLLGTNPSCAQAKAFGVWLRRRQANGAAVLRLCPNTVLTEFDNRGIEREIRTQAQLTEFYSAKFADFAIDQERYCSGNFLRIETERIYACGNLTTYYLDRQSDSKVDVAELVKSCNLAEKSNCLSARVAIHQVPAEVPTALDCGATQQELVYPTEDARRTESDAMAACDFLQFTEVRPLPEDKIRLCNLNDEMCKLVADTYKSKGLPIPGLTCTAKGNSK